MKSQLGAVARFVLLELRFEIFQERIKPVRPRTVGSAGQLHLQESKLDAHLQLGLPIRAADLADVDRPGLVIPPFEQRREIFAGCPAFGFFRPPGPFWILRIHCR